MYCTRPCWWVASSAFEARESACPLTWSLDRTCKFYLQRDVKILWITIKSCFSPLIMSSVPTRWGSVWLRKRLEKTLGTFHKIAAVVRSIIIFKTWEYIKQQFALNWLHRIPSIYLKGHGRFRIRGMRKGLSCFYGSSVIISIPSQPAMAFGVWFFLLKIKYFLY